MWIYIAFLIAALAPSIVGTRQSGRWTMSLAIYFLLLLLFLGFRYEVGPDWIGYELMYENYLYQGIDEALYLPEPGFFLLNKACEYLGLGFQGVIFACALMFLVGCFAFAKTTADPWMSIAAVLPYLIYIVAGSGIRQSVAIGIGFYVVARARTLSLVSKLLAIALAIAFHNSAVILLLFVIVPLKLSVSTRVLMVAVVSALAALAMRSTDAAEKYNSVYLVQNVVSGGAFFHLLLIAFPAAVYLFHRKRIVAVVPQEPSVHVASYLAIGLMPLLAISSTGADRLSLYLSFVQMWVYPALVEAAPAPRSVVVSGVTLIAVATFLAYFMFGTHAPSYVPYKNVLFIG